MPGTDAKKDQLMTVIFGQLECLQELSLRAEETDLAKDLSVAFMKALERYCEGKRENLATAMERGEVATPQGRRGRSKSQGARPANSLSPAVEFQAL